MEQIIELTVVRVYSGGNAGRGHYFYSFSPNIVMSQVPTTLAYVLSRETPQGLTIHWAVTSASPGQFDAPVYSRDKRTVRIHNHVLRPELINVAVVVVDETKPGEFVKCDPQVINIPD